MKQDVITQSTFNLIAVNAIKNGGCSNTIKNRGCH